jgi:hypothetical protein
MKHVDTLKCERCKHFQGYHPSMRAVICHYTISNGRKNKINKENGVNEIV